jgi:hypothetical protein
MNFSSRYLRLLTPDDSRWPVARHADQGPLGQTGLGLVISTGLPPRLYASAVRFRARDGTGRSAIMAPPGGFLKEEILITLYGDAFALL